MKKILAYAFMFAAFLIMGGASAYAQDIIIVGGKVLNKNNPPI